MTTPRLTEVHDVSPRIFTIPVGTTLHVPDGHEWFINAMAVLPTRGYVPPLGADETRNARAWGDLQIRVNDKPDAHFRTNVLTLIDRYWGRLNLNPLLPEISAKLTALQQAMYTAPKISEMYTLMDHLAHAYSQYVDAAAPKFEMPLVVPSGAKFTIEHVPSDVDTVVDTMRDIEGGVIDVQVLRALDVEVSTIIRRRVTS